MALPSLSTAEERKIIKLITGWSATKCTWDLIVAKIEIEFDIKTTRQTLPTYPLIKIAYKNKKNELRDTPSAKVLEYLRKDIDMANDNLSLMDQNEELIKRTDKQIAFIAEIAHVAKSNPAVMQVLEKVKKRIAMSVEKKS